MLPMMWQQPTSFLVARWDSKLNVFLTKNVRYLLIKINLISNKECKIFLDQHYKLFSAQTKIVPPHPIEYGSTHVNSPLIILLWKDYLFINMNKLFIFSYCLLAKSYFFQLEVLEKPLRMHYTRNQQNYVNFIWLLHLSE